MLADKEIIMNAISNLGFEVFRNGQFHWNSSNTPDMYINQDGTIHCWTSSPFKNNTTNHGDLIDFLQMTNINQTFKEAKEEAERLTGLTLPSLDSYKDNGYTVDNTNRKTGFIDEEFIKNFDVARVENFERYKELLNQALPSLDFKQQKEIALQYQIGYIKQSDRLSMPIRDEENRIVTLWKYNKNPNSYTNDKSVEVTPSKVLFTKGRDRCPFNLYDIQDYRKDMNQEIFLCGGEKDTLNMIGNGYRAITLGSENENLKDKYKPFFQDLKIVIAYDNDKAGKDGANKIFNQLQGVAKEVKIWNWENIEKNQGLNLTKGFDMTDYLSEIKKLNLEFDKTNYLGNIKEDKMKNFYKVNMQERTVYVELEATNNDEKEIKSYFKEEIQDIKQLQKEEFESIENKKVLELTPIKFNSFSIEESKNKIEIIIDGKLNPLYFENVKKEAEKEVKEILNKNGLVNYKDKIYTINELEESKNKTNRNQLKLTILEKKFDKYKEFLSYIKTKKNTQKVEQSDVKLNSDFVKNLEKEKEEIQAKTSEEKPVFISKKIEKLNEESSHIEEKINNFQSNSISKDELFRNLEKQIAEFEAMIEQLKEENRLLKRELELLIEKEKKEQESKSLEKENQSLKSKIEKTQNKENPQLDADSKEKKALKVNKVTYANTHEQEI
jgi:DNA primase